MAKSTSSSSTTSIFQSQGWTRTAGAFLGIGTSPGALFLGAGIAARYGGALPIVSLLISAAVMYALLWYQGLIGLPKPIGDGGNLTEVAPNYLGPLMQRILGAIIGLGMIGWLGFNVGLGAASLSALAGVPHWGATLLIGLPVLALSLGGLRSWNWLAALTTISVLVLVAMVGLRLAPPEPPLAASLPSPSNLVQDVAIFAGYISVFTLRTPDFSVQLDRRRDLAVSVALLVGSLLVVALAGVWLEMGTGSQDPVAVLAGPGGLGVGNLLITLSVIAPTFTTFYSGAPGLQAALGVRQRTAMWLVGVLGLFLALARFDLWLLSYLGVLGAVLPPFIIPMAVEAARRRRGHPAQRVPLWVWLPGSTIAVILTLIGHPLAPLAGLGLAGLAVVLRYLL